MTRHFHLCCGTNRLPAPWENHDIDVDLLKKLPWPDKCASHVFIEHGLEHFNGPQGFAIMEEVYRVLVPEGQFRVCVPQLGNIPTPEKRKDLIVGHGHQMVYCHETLSLMLRTAGFRRVYSSERSHLDSHHKVIGLDQDDMETLRVVALK